MRTTLRMFFSVNRLSVYWLVLPAAEELVLAELSVAVDALSSGDSTSLDAVSSTSNIRVCM